MAVWRNEDVAIILVLAFQGAPCAPSNLGKIMFHLWGTYHFYKANITHLRWEGEGNAKAKVKNFLESKGNGRTHNLAFALYISIYLVNTSCIVLAGKTEAFIFIQVTQLSAPATITTAGEASVLREIILVKHEENICVRTSKVVIRAN